MAAFVVHFQLIIQVYFFARLDCHDGISAVFDIPAAAVGIDAIFGINEIATVRQQPLNSIGVAALFIFRERDNNVADRHKAFLLQSNEIRDKRCVIAFHVGCSAPVKIAFAFQELERINGPILSKGFNDIEVPDKKDRRTAPFASIANDKIHMLRLRPDDLNIAFGKTRCSQSCSHCLSGFGAAELRRRVDLNQLLKYLACRLLQCGESLRAFGHLSVSSCGSHGHCDEE